MSGTAIVTGNLPAFLHDGVTPFPAASCTGGSLYRATGTGALTKVGALIITGSTYTCTDTGLAPGAYNYGVTFSNATGEGDMSNLYPVVIPIPAEVPGPGTIVNVVIS